MYRDGVQIQVKHLPADFENDQFILRYKRLFTETRQYYRDTGMKILRKDYKNRSSMFAFDQTPQLELNDASFELIKNVSIRVEIHFAAALTETVTAIIFAEHENLLEIDQNRSADFDYMA